MNMALLVNRKYSICQVFVRCSEQIPLVHVTYFVRIRINRSQRNNIKFLSAVPSMNDGSPLLLWSLWRIDKSTW